MRVKAVMFRILRQLRHDKRTVALMIFAPIFVLTLMYFIFGVSNYHPKIGIINAPLSFVNKLEDKEAEVTRYSEGGAYVAIRDGKLDALVDFQGGVPKIQFEGSDPNKSKGALQLIQGALMPVTQSGDIDTKYLYGYEDMTLFDNFGPILIGFFVFFFVFLISGVSFLGERNTGTLERILATPLRRWELVIGYTLGYGAFTIIQSAIIAWYSITVLNIMMIGSFFLVLVITFLTAMVGLTIGTFVSAYADNELQMVQFIPVIVIPQIFFSGLFDLSTMSPALQALAKFMPLYYVADALRNIMVKGKGWEFIWYDVLILSLICVFFIFANVIALKKHRKI